MTKFIRLECNPIYIYEKDLHNRHCDGEGYIHYINIFTGKETLEDCAYCKRILLASEKNRLMKVKQKKATDGKA